MTQGWLTSETVSILVVGLVLALADLRRRRSEKKVSNQVVVAATTVEKKTDDQTEILGRIEHDIRGVRQAQLATNEAVGRVDTRLMATTNELTTAHEETSKRLDGMAARQLATEGQVADLVKTVGVVVADVALIKQAGGMRSKDTPAQGTQAAPPPPRKEES